MIIVTGNARTGTSLMMQTLKLLGVKISGVKFLPEFGEKKFNKKGYFNLPLKDIVNGIPNKYKGTAIKADIISLKNTDPKLIDIIIICKRNTEDVINSIQKVMNGIDLGINMDKDSLLKANEKTYESIEEYSKNIPTMYINYEDMVNKPEETVKHIAKVLQIKSDTKEAIENIEGV